MMCELMTMGSLLTFYKGVSPDIKSKVANAFGDLPNELFLSWLRSLNAVRNICAHHARLWNRTLGYPPLRPNKNKYPEWHGSHLLKNDKCGIIIMIVRFLLQIISHSSQWHRRVENLFIEYPKIPVLEMGLPLEWTQHPLWARSSP